jgi:hypothetical protein
MKEKFLNLLKRPITNFYLSNISKKTIKKEFFYNLSVVFIKNFNKKNILIDVVNSDEGGRFYRNETRNIVSGLKGTKSISLIKNIYGLHPIKL